MSWCTGAVRSRPCLTSQLSSHELLLASQTESILASSDHPPKQIPYIDLWCPSNIFQYALRMIFCPVFLSVSPINWTLRATSDVVPISGARASIHDRLLCRDFTFTVLRLVRCVWDKVALHPKSLLDHSRTILASLQYIYSFPFKHET